MTIYESSLGHNQSLLPKDFQRRQNQTSATITPLSKAGILAAEEATIKTNLDKIEVLLNSFNIINNAIDDSSSKVDDILSCEICCTLYSDVRPRYGPDTEVGRKCRRLLEKIQDFIRLEPDCEGMPDITVCESPAPAPPPSRFRSLFTKKPTNDAPPRQRIFSDVPETPPAHSTRVAQSTPAEEPTKKKAKKKRKENDLEESDAVDRNRKATAAYYADYSNFSDNSLKITIRSKSSQSSTFASQSSTFETQKGSEPPANWKKLLPKPGQKGCHMCRMALRRTDKKKCNCGKMVHIECYQGNDGSTCQNTTK